MEDAGKTSAVLEVRDLTIRSSPGVSLVECDASLGWRCADSGALVLQHMSPLSICVPQPDLCVSTSVSHERVYTMTRGLSGNSLVEGEPGLA